MKIFDISHPIELTLFANKTHGTGFPSGNCTLLSKSVFHLVTASKVDPLVTSKTMKHPTASL